MRRACLGRSQCAEHHGRMEVIVAGRLHPFYRSYHLCSHSIVRSSELIFFTSRHSHSVGSTTLFSSCIEMKQKTNRKHHTPSNAMPGGKNKNSKSSGKTTTAAAAKNGSRRGGTNTTPPGAIVPQATESKDGAPTGTTTAAFNSSSNTNNNDTNATASRTVGQAMQFPWKLHEMLTMVNQTGQEDVVSWLPGGKGFKVHKKLEFCRDIMPVYFNSSKYKTFQRSLNLWGFESISKGADRGACFHPLFLQNQPDLCKNMKVSFFFSFFGGG